MGMMICPVFCELGETGSSAALHLFHDPELGHTIPLFLA